MGTCCSCNRDVDPAHCGHMELVDEDDQTIAEEEYFCCEECGRALGLTLEEYYHMIEIEIDKDYNNQAEENVN